tara:strand:+ start:58 stop:1524 length:1467 start_codon:yes stop_codon:yes gene_type:complete
MFNQEGRESYTTKYLPEKYTKEEAENNLSLWRVVAQINQISPPTIEQLKEIRCNLERQNLNNTVKTTAMKLVISETQVETRYYVEMTWNVYSKQIIEAESRFKEETKRSLRKIANNLYNKAINDYLSEIEAYKQEIILLQEAINLKKNAQQNQSAPVPNHVINTLRNVQQSRLKDIMAGGQKTKQLLVALINGNTSLADEEKEEELDKVRNCEQNAEYQIDCYLGAEFTHEEILFIRAISVIVFNMIRAGEIENHLGLIYIPWHKIYKECGVPLRSDGEGYNPRSSKKIRDVLDLESNLRKDILIKNDFGKETGDTRFISDPQPHIRLVKQKNGSEALIEQHIGVSLRISPYLFFPNGYDDKEFQKFTLIDNAALIRFKKVNKTKVGFSLFIWLEKLISQQNVFKILDWDTIIKTLNLQAEEKKNPKRLKDNIERAFQNMEKQKALITNFKEQKGSRCQRQYYFVNSRYKEKIATIKGSKGTQKPRKK